MQIVPMLTLLEIPREVSLSSWV